MFRIFTHVMTQCSPGFRVKDKGCFATSGSPLDVRTFTELLQFDKENEWAGPKLAGFLKFCGSTTWFLIEEIFTSASHAVVFSDSYYG